MRKELNLLLASAVMIGAAMSARALQPTHLMARSQAVLNIELKIPKAFGRWTEVPGVHLIEPQGDTLSKLIYNQEVVRGFKDERGRVVMFLIAYGEDQSERLQMHRPEVCYAADGFQVSPSQDVTLKYAVAEPAIALRTLVTRREDRVEPITYWMRIGYDVSERILQRQRLKIEYGLRGLIPDGALFRVSTVGIQPSESFELQRQFIRELIDAVDPVTKTFLIGEPSKAFLGT